MKRFLTVVALGSALLMGSAQTEAQKAEAFDNTMLGTVIGAVGGGVIGSHFGKGDGRMVATAAGSVIGAVIGREMASNTYDYPREERRVVYERPAPRPETKVVIVKERERIYDRRDDHERDHYKYDHPKYKKWKQTARYGDDVLVCHKNSKRCHWDD